MRGVRFATSGPPCRSPACEYDDGPEGDVGPGNVYVIEPGHDAWVVGDRRLRRVMNSNQICRRVRKGFVDGINAGTETFLTAKETYAGRQHASALHARAILSALTGGRDPLSVSLHTPARGFIDSLRPRSAAGRHAGQIIPKWNTCSTSTVERLQEVEPASLCRLVGQGRNARTLRDGEKTCVP
jgi:hypothetical protein